MFIQLRSCEGDCAPNATSFTNVIENTAETESTALTESAAEDETTSYENATEGVPFEFLVENVPASFYHFTKNKVLF